MNEFWFITIWDGQNGIDYLFIDGAELPEVVIEYMLWLTYCEKRWDFANDVLEGDDVNICYAKDDPNQVDIYCCNHLPDISIEKKTTLVLNMKYQAHKMHTVIGRI